MSDEQCAVSITYRQRVEDQQVRCEKAADHDGHHQASVKGEWETVLWTDGSRVVTAPRSRKRP